MSRVARPPVNSKRHTKPCIYFQSKQCPFTEDECDFAHVYDEHAAAEAGNLRAKYRTKPCRYYLLGSCVQGNWCRFKHPLSAHPDYRADSSALGLDVDGSDADTASSLDVRDVNTDWKRQREQHPKYKTRPCRDFLLGKCRRGTDCSYLHPPQARASHAPTYPHASSLVSVPSPALSLSSPYDAAFPGAAGYSSATLSYMYYPSAPTFSTDTLMLQHALAHHCDGVPSEGTLPSSASPTTPSEHSSSLDDGPPTPLDQQYSSSSMTDPAVAAMRKLADPFGSGTPPPSSFAPPPQGTGVQGHLYGHPGSPVAVVHVPVPVAFGPINPGYHAYYAPPPVPAPALMPPHPPRAPRSRAKSQPSPSARRKSPALKTKPCKFYNTAAGCPKGDKCNFIHDLPGKGKAADEPPPLPVPQRKVAEQTKASAAPHTASGLLPRRPTTSLDEQRKSGYYPITWRVIGGGVLMGGGAPKEPCPDMSSNGHCRQGDRCSFEHPESTSGYATSCAPPDREQTEHGDEDPSLGGSPRRKRSGKNLSISIPAPPAFAPELVLHDDESELVDAAWTPGRTRDERAAPRSKSTPSSPTFAHVNVQKLFSAELP